MRPGGAGRRWLPPTARLVESWARAAWDEALQLGEAHGYRNAQATVIAPTGTIGLVMDCDTTGIEPDFALVKFKKLAGGGYFKIINQSVPAALRKLGYGEAQIGEIIAHAVGHGSLGQGARHQPYQLLIGPRLWPERRIKKVVAALPVPAFAYSARIQPVDTGRGILRDQRWASRRAEADHNRAAFRPAAALGLYQGAG